MASCHASATDLRMLQNGQGKTCKSIRMPQGTSDYRDQIFHSKAFCLQRPPLPQFTTIHCGPNAAALVSIARPNLHWGICILLRTPYFIIFHNFITFHHISSYFIVALFATIFLILIASAPAQSRPATRSHRWSWMSASVKQDFTRSSERTWTNA